MGKYLGPKFDHRAAPPMVQQLEVNAGLSSRIIDGVKIDFLNPPAEGTADNHKLDENNRSAVVRLTYGDFSALFTGDIERHTEKTLLSNGNNLHSTVLKVPHHGAADSASPPFFSQVRPEVAVISVGKYNRFLHPRPRTLSLLQNLGAATYRTDRDGAISITSDGKTYSIKTYAQSFKPNDIRRILK
jgi:competence protein ComEC